MCIRDRCKVVYNYLPVFSSGCGCCGVNNGQLFERTWDEVLDFINESQNKPMDKRTEADEIILNKLQNGYKIL